MEVFGIIGFILGLVFLRKLLCWKNNSKNLVSLKNKRRNPSNNYWKGVPINQECSGFLKKK